MIKYIYGLEPDYGVSVKKLLDEDYDGIVLGGGDMKAFPIAQEAGLETWLCYRAHSGNPLSNELGAIDAEGNPAPWFGSVCPNAAEVNDHNMNAAIKIAKKAKVTGIIVDGARFASFASVEGMNSFWGCFCPRCMKKMEQYGMDALLLRESTAELMGYLRGVRVLEQDVRFRKAISDMLKFRKKCVKVYMDTLAARAHAEGMKAGAFVFTPSLWDFVGQGSEALDNLDMVAPMIYRNYPHENGPACLGHEWAAFQKLVSGTERLANEIAEKIFGRTIPNINPMKGFTTDFVGEEVATAAKALEAMLKKNMVLLPIIQTEDELLEKVRNIALENGADGCGEFCFRQKKWQ